MSKRVQHPFTITIGSPSRMRGHYSWHIRRSSQVVKDSGVTYATFEEARLAGKGMLDRMIAEWCHQSHLNAAA